MRFPRWSRGLIVAAQLWLAGCATGPNFQEPVVGLDTPTQDELLALPAPARKIAVAVYAFEDETGQFEFSDTVQTLSRAVTQGATSILIEALLKAGTGSWFTVVEREGLDNLLRERQIIRETRAIYEGGGDLSRSYLPPLLFAGMILEGGIIGYDVNTLTGGIGAALLGIGGSTEFRQDTVAVYLRAVSTQSGEILVSVNVSKTIFSVGISADVFRFISSDEILQIDAGVSANEPEHIAVTQAIDKAVTALILQGARDGNWAFADQAAAAALLGTEPEAADAGQAEAKADRPDGTAAPIGSDRVQRSSRAGPRPAPVASSAAPVTAKLAAAPTPDGRTLEPNAPEARAAPATAADPAVDEAMQALRTLIAEAAGAERNGGVPEIDPLPGQPNAPAGPPDRAPAPERPSPNTRARTPGEAMLAGLAESDNPDPRMGER